MTHENDEVFDDPLDEEFMGRFARNLWGEGSCSNQALAAELADLEMQEVHGGLDTEEHRRMGFLGL